jgi:hypothetical protein
MSQTGAIDAEALERPLPDEDWFASDKDDALYIRLPTQPGTISLPLDSQPELYYTRSQQGFTWRRAGPRPTST